MWRRAIHHWDPPKKEEEMTIEIGDQLASIIQQEKEINEQFQSKLEQMKNDVVEEESSSVEEYNAANLKDGSDEWLDF